MTGQGRSQPRWGRECARLEGQCRSGLLNTAATLSKPAEPACYLRAAGAACLPIPNASSGQCNQFTVHAITHEHGCWAS